jgi:hypothetical protein
LEQFINIIIISPIHWTTWFERNLYSNIVLYLIRIFLYSRIQMEPQWHNKIHSEHLRKTKFVGRFQNLNINDIKFLHQNCFVYLNAYDSYPILISIRLFRLKVEPVNFFNVYRFGRRVYEILRNISTLIWAIKLQTFP